MCVRALNNEDDKLTDLRLHRFNPRDVLRPFIHLFMYWCRNSNVLSLNEWMNEINTNESCRSINRHASHRDSFKLLIELNCWIYAARKRNKKTIFSRSKLEQSIGLEFMCLTRRIFGWYHRCTCEQHDVDTHKLFAIKLWCAHKRFFLLRSLKEEPEMKKAFVVVVVVVWKKEQNWVHKSTSQFSFLSFSYFRSDTTMSVQGWTWRCDSRKYDARKGKLGRLWSRLMYILQAVIHLRAMNMTVASYQEWKRQQGHTKWVRSHLPTVVHPLNYHLIFLLYEAKTCEESLSILIFPFFFHRVCQIFPQDRHTQKKQEQQNIVHFAVCATCLSTLIDISSN